MADIVQADYEQLTAIGHRFQSQSETTVEMQAALLHTMNDLKEGGWIGRGSEAFFTEMESEVLPASRRLGEALLQAHTLVNQIASLIKSAEEAAASPFKNGNGAVRPQYPGAGPVNDGTLPGGHGGSGTDGIGVGDPTPGGDSGQDLPGRIPGIGSEDDDYGIPDEWLDDVRDGLAHDGLLDNGIDSDWLQDVQDAFDLESDGGGESGGGGTGGGSSDLPSSAGEGTDAEGGSSGSAGGTGSGAGSASGTAGGGNSGGSGGGMGNGAGSGSGTTGGGSSGGSGAGESGSSTPSGASSPYQTPAEAGFRFGMSDYTPGNATMSFSDAGAGSTGRGSSGSLLERAGAMVNSVASGETSIGAMGVPLGLAAMSPFLALFGKALRNSDDDE